MNHIALVRCIMLLLIVALPAIGQERGQYIPGTGGLNSGLQPPEGITYANLFTWYPSTKFKDRNGDTLPVDVDIDLLVDINLVALGWVLHLRTLRIYRQVSRPER
jgi:hypothetical protein